jgi:HAMP domain-containing protein
MRWKILTGNVVLVVLLGALAWFFTRSSAADALAQGVDPSVGRGGTLLEAVRNQDGQQLLNACMSAAASPDLAAVFAEQTVSAQRGLAFTYADGLARSMATTLPRRGRPAELVVVISREGEVLARNVERNVDAGHNLRQDLPAVGQVLDTGRAARDYLNYNQQGWLEVAVAPAVVGGQVRGALLVGYALADSAARNDADRIGVGVGYLLRENDRYVVQSLSVGAQGEKNELRDWANQNGNSFQNMLRARPRVTLTLGGEEYRAQVLPMPGAQSAAAGAIILQSVSEARAPAGGVAMPILLLTLLALLGVLAYNLFIANYLEKPIEQIEDGLLQIINGNRDFRLGLEHPELGGIVYRINQLVQELTGQEEADEQGRVSHPPPRSEG